MWEFLTKRKCPNCNGYGLSPWSLEKYGNVKEGQCQLCSTKILVRRNFLTTLFEYLYAAIIMLTAYVVILLSSKKVLIAMLVFLIFVIFPYLLNRFSPSKLSVKESEANGDA